MIRGTLVATSMDQVTSEIITQSNASNTERSIGVIGMACTYAGARNVEEFWRNIVNKVDAITDPSSARLAPQIFFDPSGSEHQFLCKRGGWLGDSFSLNPVKYGIMPSTLVGSEPDHFLVLRTVHEALEDAGYGAKDIDRVRVNMILGKGSYPTPGVGALVYRRMIANDLVGILSSLHPEYSPQELQEILRALNGTLPPLSPEVAAGLVPNVCSGRVSNRLDFMGPNFTVDAACASSLIAAELGIKDLLNGAADMVIVGGVNVSVETFILPVFEAMRATSPTSTIKPYDESADGTVPGEGVGILILKRLADAERDGDRVYAAILGTGSSSDGRARSVTAPRVEGQEVALRRAYESSGVSPRTIELIEGHGTGTPVGDAAEIDALQRVFGVSDEGRSTCALGSVKSMIGHAMPAAGAAGLIKTVLALYHRVLPPTINCQKPRSEVATPESRFYINSETRPWIRKLSSGRRRAGVSAFGFGGINAHMVLEEYTSDAARERPTLLREWNSEVVVIEAESREALREKLIQLRNFVLTAQGVALRDVAYTCNANLLKLEQRVSIVATSLADLAHKLNSAATLPTDPSRLPGSGRNGIYYFGNSDLHAGKLALLFPGEGSQYVNMLRDLCLHFPEIQKALEQADYVPDTPTKIAAGWPLSAIMFPPPFFSSAEAAEANRRLLAADGAIGSLIAAEYAMARLLSSLELKPDLIVGHSAGEWAAMIMAGVVEPNEFVSKVRTLTGVAQKLAGDSAVPSLSMLIIGAGRETVTELLQIIDRKAHLVSDNCPNQIVIVVDAGDERAIIDHLQRHSIMVEKLPYTSGFHTPVCSAMSAPLRQFLSSIEVRKPVLPLYSCATGEPYPSDPAAIRGLVADMFAQPVLFRQTLENLYEAGARIYVETGPRGNLTAFVKDILGQRPHLAVSIDQFQRPGLLSLHQALGMLAAMHVPLNLAPLYDGRGARQLSFDAKVDSRPDPDQEPGTVQISTCWPQLRVPFTVAGSSSAPAESSQPTIQSLIDVRAPASDNVLASAVTTLLENAVSPPSSEAASLMADHFAVMEKLLQTESALMMQFLGSSGASEMTDNGGFVSDPQLAVSVASSQRETYEFSGETQIPSQARQLQSAPSPLDAAEILLQVVSERTGYSREILDFDLDLEADLGIDSIKRVEILGSLRQLGGDSTAWDNGQGEEISKAKTLRQILALIQATRSSTHGNEFADSMPLLSSPTITSHDPGRTVSLRCYIDAQEHAYLSDHCLYFPASESNQHVSPDLRMPMTGSIEMMAEAAAMLSSESVLVEVRDIYARRWITVEQDGPPTALTLDAVRIGENVIRVTMRSEPQGETEVVAEGTFRFDAAYPYPPAPEALVLQNQRPLGHQGAAIYRDRLLFHGPSFQGLSLMESIGDDGSIARLRVLPRNDLLRSQPNPEFHCDPFLLDAATQVAGYWALQSFSEGGTVFPFRVGQLISYGKQLDPGAEITCQVRVTEINRQQIRVDFDLIEANGRLLLRMVGWEAMRFYVERHLLEFLRFPNQGYQGVCVDIPALCGSNAECSFLAPLKEKNLWGDTFMRLVLNKREMAELRRVDDPSLRASQFSGRSAAKDAVRRWVKARFDRDLYPADVEIIAGGDGKYSAAGYWTHQLNAHPFVSASHRGEVAVGVASDHEVEIAIESSDQGDCIYLAASRLLFCDPSDAAKWLRRHDEATGVFIFENGPRRIAVYSTSYKGFRIAVATAGPAGRE